MKTEKELSEFLKKHGVYREFVKLIKQNYTIEDDSPLEYYCKEIASGEDEYISASFIWSKSKKGLDFWSELNKKWKS